MLTTEEVYRPRKLAAALPLLAPLLMAFFYNGRDPAQQRMISWVTAGCLLASLVLLVLLGATSIRVDRQGILFKKITGERLLGWPSLRAVYVRRVFRGKSSRLEMRFEQDNGKRPARLNTRLYSRRSLQALASAVAEMAPQAQLDEKVRGFSEGRFPWYVR